VIERRTHVGATVAAWLKCGSDASFGAPTWVRQGRVPAEVREITPLAPIPRRETAIWDPN